MKSRLFNPAMVVALVALALSVGGTAYAVTRLPANSVGSRQVVDHSLLRRDLHSGVLAITGRPLVKVVSAFPPPTGANEDAFIPCPQGSFATGGGFLGDFGADRDVVVLGSAPTTMPGSDSPDNSHPNGWMVRLVNHGTTQRQVKYYVVCVRGEGG